MLVRLPIGVQRTPLPPKPRELVKALAAAVARSGTDQGYLLAEVAGSSLLLFLLKGRTYCAGALDDDGRPRSISVRELVEELGAGVQAARFCATDLPLFLCSAVLVRKAPAAQIPGKLLDSDTLLRFLAETGRDSVLVVRRGDARSMVFCDKGSPVRLYPADGETFPDDDEITDRIVGYVYAQGPTEVAIDVYDEIHLRPGGDAGSPVTNLALADPAARPVPVSADPIVLAVKLGERVVFHHKVRDTITIGRGFDNDLELDNPSVSRKHALVRRDRNLLLIEDLGSQNGILVDGKRVPNAALASGDEITIGKYTLAYLRYAPAKLTPPRPSSLRSPISANDQTFSLPYGARAMLIDEAGEAQTIRGLTFVIGKSAKADLRLRGRGIGDEHVRILRTPQGTYRAEAGNKKKAFDLDGESVTSAELASGDELGVGKHKFRFVLSTSTPLPRRPR